MTITPLLGHFSMLNQLKSLSCSSNIYVMIKPYNFYLENGHFLMQEVLTSESAILRPYNPIALPDLTEELAIALNIVSSHETEDDLCLVYSPTELTVPSQHFLTQRVDREVILLNVVTLADLNEDSVLHATQIFNPVSSWNDKFLNSSKVRLGGSCGVGSSYTLSPLESCKAYPMVLLAQ